MKLHIRHTTDYRYSEPLRYALQTLWLTPQSSPAQTKRLRGSPSSRGRRTGFAGLQAQRTPRGAGSYTK